MATRKFGLSIQEEWRAVAAGAGGAVTDDVEITITDTLTKEQAILLIEKIEDYIAQNGVT